MGDKRDLDDIDRFWDLESLLPQRRKVSPDRSVNTDTVELEIGADDGKESKNRFGGSSIPPRTAQPEPVDERLRMKELSMRIKARQNEPKPLEPYLIYTPKNTLIKKVSISKWQTRFNFYNRFRTDAAKFWERTSTECKPVSFFSYVPQHNQLSYAQLKWYLYWRDQMRKGNYIDTDYSYILLYIYEIINCPELVEPSQGVQLLCRIWASCRAKYPRIDNYLSEWLCDYCLIYEQPCPTEQLQPFLQAVISASTFKEFYMDTDRITEGAANMLSFTTNYDWRTSRYVTRDNIGLFSTHINGAFSKVYRELLSKDDNADNPRQATIMRDSYSGGLCTWDMKRCITVDYISYSRSPKFRFVVTDIIRYSENRIRSALGIKAKLKVDTLSDGIKHCIDEYFDANLPIPGKKPKGSSKQKQPEQTNDYDRLYEPAHRQFSLENALEIEKKSWSTTEILTAALDGDAGKDNIGLPETEPVQATKPAVKSEPEKSFHEVGKLPDMDNSANQLSSEDEFGAFVTSLDPDSLEALKLLADGDSAAIEKIAAKHSTLADALADRINESAFDIIGDSVIEPTGSGYRLIPDYEEDIKSCLK